MSRRPGAGHQVRQCTMDDLKGMIRPATDDWEARIAINDQCLRSLKDKALRRYYRKQSELMASFVEVDQVLASSLPRDVLHTFQRREPQHKPYGTLDGSSRQSDSHGHSHEVEIRIDGGGEAGEQERLLGASYADDAGGGPAARRDERWERWGLNLNIGVNLLLLGIKAVASLASDSLSLFASALDSALDVLSTAIIWITSRAASGRSRRRQFPAGKRRFQPLGILIFAVLQITAFSQVFLESVTRLVDKKSESEIIDLSWFGKGVILFTIGIKLFIFLVTRSMKDSGVAALAQDAINDVYFNTASLVFPWLGAQFRIKQLDPIGGALLSLYVIFQWCKTLFENFVNLSGRVADNERFSVVLYLVSRFNWIEHVSNIEVYHAGDDLIVEVDVCLPPDTSLHLAHDVGEVMQTAIEALDGVARCFVHLDYNSAGPQAHLPREEQHHALQNGTRSP